MLLDHRQPLGMPLSGHLYLSFRTFLLRKDHTEIKLLLFNNNVCCQFSFGAPSFQGFLGPECPKVAYHSFSPRASWNCIACLRPQSATIFSFLFAHILRWSDPFTLLEAFPQALKTTRRQIPSPWFLDDLSSFPFPFPLSVSFLASPLLSCIPHPFKTL